MLPASHEVSPSGQLHSELRHCCSNSNTSLGMPRPVMYEENTLITRCGRLCGAVHIRLFLSHKMIAMEVATTLQLPLFLGHPFPLLLPHPNDVTPFPANLGFYVHCPIELLEGLWYYSNCGTTPHPVVCSTITRLLLLPNVYMYCDLINRPLTHSDTNLALIVWAGVSQCNCCQPCDTSFLLNMDVAEEEGS